MIDINEYTCDAASISGLSTLRQLLSWYVWCCAALILSIQALSLISGIAVWPFLAVAAPILVSISIAIKPWRLKRGFSSEFSRCLAHPLLIPLAIALPVMCIILFALGWHVPANNWDSMTYHLSRAAYWREWHSLAHFPSYYWAQNANPGNAEILLLVTLLVVHSAKVAFLVQFMGYIVSTIAVYGLGRLLGISSVFAMVGAGFFATMPEVVLQATSTQNDLIAASFTLCAVFFLLDAVHARKRYGLLVAGVALGLAIGTKPTAIFLLPGLCLGVATIVLFKRRVTFRSFRCASGTIAIAMTFVMILGAPWYLANKVDYGNITGPSQVTHVEDVVHPSPTTLRTNLLRYFIGFIDPEGPAMLIPGASVSVCNHFADMRTQLANIAGIARTHSTVDWLNVQYSPAPTCIYQEDLSWFGLGGWLVVMISCMVFAYGIIRRRIGFAWVLSAGVVSFLIVISLLLRWSPWQQRLLITAVALGSPLLGLVMQALWQRRVRLWRPVLQLCVLYTVLTGLGATIDNSSKPLSAWGANREDMQVITRPEMGPIMRRIAQTVPANGRIGAFLRSDDWDFLLFGPQLTRTVEPLVLGTKLNAYTIRPSTLDYVVTDQSSRAVKALLRQTYLTACQSRWTVESWSLYYCTRRRGTG